MLYELYSKNKIASTGHWTPCAPVSDRLAWESLPSKNVWFETGFSLYRKSAQTRIPPLSLSLWTEFTRTGNRTHFEKNYFARRRNLCCLVMAECVENKNRFLPAIGDSIWAILEESAWQLPAHNSYKRDTPQLPLPDPAHPVIDLFAAETGALLAVTWFLLQKKLASAMPSLPERIKSELDRRIIRPYLSTHFWWMGNEDEPMCNWTPWCTQNVLITAALLHPGKQDMIRKMIEKASYSLDCFLKDYGTDGCCNEGAQYYRHAALTFYNSLEILSHLLPGTFEEAWSDRKIRNMTEYIAYMHVGGPWYFNFSDCSPKAGYRGAREYLFGKRTASSLLTDFAAQDFCADTDPYRLTASDDSEGINLFYHIQTSFTENEIRAYHAAHISDPLQKIRPENRSHFYERTGLLICHYDPFAVGIKAGNNADSHNHDDTGSFTLYKNGLPVLVDIGVESYTAKTFSARRYEIWTMQSSWHNLPEFDPDGNAYMQQAGSEYAAGNVSLYPDGSGLSMDIAAAYAAHGEVPGLSFYNRNLCFSVRHSFTLRDETDYPGTVALTFMTMYEPVVSQKNVSVGTTAQLRITGSEKIAAEKISIKDPRLLTAWPNYLYRIRIYFHGSIKVEIL